MSRERHGNRHCKRSARGATGRETPREAAPSALDVWQAHDSGAVRFDQLPSNILIDALSFKVAGNALLADSTFSGTRVQVVLAKE